MTAEQRANLEKLAAYLESGELRARFDMGVFAETVRETPTCGSVGCAIGHGPYAGIPKLVHEDWVAYAERVFGNDDGQITWCFSPTWGEIDNTPQGAARRIRYMLEHGLPADFVSQSYGKAPYLFAEATP